MKLFPEKNKDVSQSRFHLPVSKTDCLNHYTWKEGCEGWLLASCAGFSVKQEKMASATSEQEHYHQYANQFFFVLSGKAEIFINGVKRILQEGEGLQVEPEQRHFISNPFEADLEFLLFSQPAIENDRINIIQD